MVSRVAVVAAGVGGTATGGGGVVVRHSQPRAPAAGGVQGRVALGDAAVLDRAVLLGALGVAALAGLQLWWVRRAPPAVKVLGMRQMALGLSLVVVTALGLRVT